MTTYKPEFFFGYSCAGDTQEKRPKFFTSPVNFLKHAAVKTLKLNSPQLFNKPFEILQQAASGEGKPFGLVYGIPKTGNTTLRATASTVMHPFGVMGAHFLSDASICSKLGHFHLHPDSVKADVAIALRDSLLLQGFLKSVGFYHGYAALKPPQLRNYKIPLICGVRDPWRLVVSSIFYHFRKESPEVMIQKMEEAITPSQEHWITAQENWFATNFIPLTGFDPFERPFDKEQGYSIYETESFRILLIRTEKIATKLPMALGELLSLSPESIVVRDRNLGSERSNSQHYKNALKNIVPSSDMLQQMYESRFAKHFLLESECADALTKATALGAVKESVANIKCY
jgi:hypothetical protein